MKTKFYFLSAFATMLALVACNKEPKVEDNPTFDPEKNTVNTQFIVNVSTGVGEPATKQTPKDVQASFEHFRGIENAHVLAYTLNYAGVGGENYLYDADNKSSKATRDFDLGSLVLPSQLTSEDSRRIIELALPLETNTILIYGRAPKTGTDDEQGSVKYSGTALNSSLTNVKFELNHRLSVSDTAAFRQTRDLLGRILTGIMNAGRVMQTPANGHKGSVDSTYKFWWPVDDASKNFSWEDEESAHPGYKKYSGSKRWKDYGDAYKANPGAMSIALEASLGEAYYEVMNLKGVTGKQELRSASAGSICRMVGDMYNVIQRVLSAIPVVPEEYVAQLVARNALSRATSFFTYDPSTRIMNFRTRAEIMDGVDLLIPDRDADFYSRVPESALYYKKISPEDTRTEYRGYPVNFGLPIGAAVMSFITVPPTAPAENQFIVVTVNDKIPAYGLGPAAPDFDVRNYCYPAELVYYTNSSLRTSSDVAERSDYPATASYWNDPTRWASKWTGNTVKSNTRSVAISKPINYGTALLKSQFAYSGEEIEDNNSGVHPGESNNKINVTGENEPFYVTGILVAGLCDSVGWDFLPNGTSYNNMVYDNLGGKKISIPPYNGEPTYSSPTYTCVWDNYVPQLADDKQTKAYVGVEMVNNTGRDIWGELNLIRDGGTFYVVGELDPSDKNALKNLMKNSKVDLSRPDMFYPPFDSEGKTKNAPRVYMQDYVTIAKFKFSSNTLKHAYVTMPDLRAGQVSLGMSVDLTWKPGMEFEVEMGNTGSGNAGSGNAGNN